MIWVCPRCGGAEFSVLHELCEARLKLAEKSEGWRLNQVRIRPEIKALMGPAR